MVISVEMKLSLHGKCPRSFRWFTKLHFFDYHCCLILPGLMDAWVEVFDIGLISCFVSCFDRCLCSDCVVVSGLSVMDEMQCSNSLSIEVKVL